MLLIDTQLSAFWNQHPSRQLSIFAHNIALPCSRSLWDAPSSLAWHNARLAPPSALPAASGSGSGSAPGPGEPLSPSAPMSHARKPRPGYLPGLHPEFQVSAVSEGYSAAVFAALAAEQPDHRLPFRVDLENKLADELVLIGLMAVAWDCRTRGGMGIRLRDGTKHWRGIVLHGASSLDLRLGLGLEIVKAATDGRSGDQPSGSMGERGASHCAVHRDQGHAGLVCHLGHLRAERHVRLSSFLTGGVRCAPG